MLQSTSTGSVVYSETHNTTTNFNGLVSIMIGNGTLLSGNFNSINWGSGPYYIKTETDPTGGTNYTLISTSQLLSVPYALYAENSGTPDPQGTQGIQGIQGLTGNNGKNALLNTTAFTSSTLCVNGGTKIEVGIDADNNNVLDITEIDNAKTQYICNGTNGAQGIQGLTGATGSVGATGAQGPAGNDGVGGVSTAGTNITITGAGTLANPYVISSSVPTPTYAIGLNNDLGGYVFYVTPDGEHGLVSATQDQLAGIGGTWADAFNALVNPTKHNVTGKNFTDWRLPTTYELGLMYTQRVAIGGFVVTGGYTYWTSVEGSLDNIEAVSFTGGSVTTQGKSSGGGLARAVRSF